MRRRVRSQCRARVDDVPVLPAGISEVFLPATPGPGALSYRPAILGQARLHYVDKKAAVDAWQSMALLAPVDGTAAQWDEASELPADAGTRLGNAPAEGASFEEPAAAVTNAGAWAESEEVTGRRAVPVASPEALQMRRARRGLDPGRISRGVQGAALALGPRAARR